MSDDFDYTQIIHGGLDRKPRGYWNFKTCLCDARYSGATASGEWSRIARSAYMAAVRGKWLEGIAKELGWDIKEYKPRGYWTLENCIEHAKQSGATSIGVWAKLPNNGGYTAAYRNGMIPDVAKAMGWPEGYKPKGYWTRERCVEAAVELGVTNIAQWAEAGGGSYSTARTNGWVREIAEELQWTVNKPPNYWNRQTCAQDARESGATGLREWQYSGGGGYQHAFENGWTREIAEEVGWKVFHHDNSAEDTVIYQYCDGTYIYIGETNSPENRHNDHFFGRGKSIVYNYMDLDIDPCYIMDVDGLEPYHMSGYLAMRVERRLIRCAAAQGFKVLNKHHNPQWDGTTFSWEKEKKKVA